MSKQHSSLYPLRRIMSLLIAAAVMFNTVPIAAAKDNPMPDDTTVTLSGNVEDDTVVDSRDPQPGYIGTQEGEPDDGGHDPEDNAEPDGDISEDGGDPEPGGAETEPKNETGGRDSMSMGYSITGFAALTGDVKNQSVPQGTPLKSLTLPETLEATVSDGEDETTAFIGVAWQSEPEYDPDGEGTYEFTAALPDGCTLADGVSPPAITVMVESNLAAAPGTGGVITAFEPLLEEVAAQTVPFGTALEDLSLPDALAATLEGEPNAVEVPVASWSSQPEYDGIEGDYVFTPSFGAEWELAPDVDVPFVAVTVESSGIMLASSEITHAIDTGPITLVNGYDYIITQNNPSTSTTNNITAPDGYNGTVTLSGVNIYIWASNVSAFGLGRGAEVNLILVGNNKLKSGDERAGLEVPGSSSITIGGDGSLEVTGGARGAGIGSGHSDNDNGRLSITINSGNITATAVNDYDRAARRDGAAIGTGANAGEEGCTITINGGNVTATGSLCGAAIGGGMYSCCGTIAINGGTVKAIKNGGNSLGAAIGNGDGYFDGIYHYRYGDCEISIGTEAHVTISAFGEHNALGRGTTLGTKNEGTLVIENGCIVVGGADRFVNTGTITNEAGNTRIVINHGTIDNSKGEIINKAVIYNYGTIIGTVTGNPPISKPGVPTNVSATAGDKEITVEFEPPADNGGLPITGYRVEVRPGAISKAGTESPITVTGLTNGQDYGVVVYASNEMSEGPGYTLPDRVTPMPLVDFEGSGTPEDPYTIWHPYQLKLLAERVNDSVSGNSYSGKFFKLTADIALSDDWTPIGNSLSRMFSGTFDGNGHTIAGVKVNIATAYAGLFGYVQNGKIVNLGVEYVDINTSHDNPNAGGLVGYNVGGNIINCYSTGSVRGGGGGGQYGGLIGNNTGSITNCYSTVNVTGGGYRVGGLVGQHSGGTVANCYASGNITANNSNSYVGGLVGLLSDGTVTTCYWNSDATHINGTPQSSKKGVGNGTDNTTGMTAAAMRAQAFADTLNTNRGGDSTLKAWHSVSSLNGGFPGFAPETETVSSMSIAGVTAPAFGAVPVTEIEETEQYTGTVTPHRPFTLPISGLASFNQRKK